MWTKAREKKQSDEVLRNKLTQAKLQQIQEELDELRSTRDSLKKFFADINDPEKWSEPSKRVIGFVCWAPSIDLNDKGYTRDICVVELHKEKFKHMMGNSLNIGTALISLQIIANHRSTSLPVPELDLPDGCLRHLLYECDGKLPDYVPLDDGLLELNDMLTTSDIEKLPDVNEVRDRDPEKVVCKYRVTKNGAASGITVGTLCNFESYCRDYGESGYRNSLEVPIIPHEDVQSYFSFDSDPGSIIVTPSGKYVALGRVISFKTGLAAVISPMRHPSSGPGIESRRNSPGLICILIILRSFSQIWLSS